MPILATNKRANFDYKIEERWEAGIELTGPEVKSMRAGQISLAESYVMPRRGEIFLVGAHVSPYKKAAQVTPNPLRDRRLLLRKAEINRLIGLKTAQGLTVVPLKVYTKGHRIKLEIGLGRGRKKIDKRELIKKRDMDRDLRRADL